MPQVPLTPQLAVEQQALTERLRRARHFRTLPPVAMRTLVDVARVRSMRAGEVLWRAGDAGTGFTFVDRGLVMISTPRSNGGAAVLGGVRTRRLCRYLGGAGAGAIPRRCGGAGA
jgi:CRP-like cAMP-binding protein